jgi:hypothetical protein
MGAFMMFVLRDALKYLGLYPDKRMNKDMCEGWVLKMNQFRQEFFTQKSKLLSGYIAKIEGGH